MATAVGRLLAVVGFVVASRPLADNSFLTHLATGRLILATGSVPTVDPYSYPANGDPWTVQSWLVSLVYAVLEAGPGPSAIRVVHGLFGAWVVWGVWRATEPARQILTRVGLVAVVLLTGTYLWPPRPLLVGLVATVLVLEVVQGRRRAWWLLPIFWVWVNSHGSFVLGGALVATVAVGAAIDERGVPWMQLRAVVMTGLGTVAAVVNPLQWRLLWFPFHLMSRREALDRVSEWASPSFHSPIEMVFLAVLPIALLAARRGAPWRDLLPSLVFVVGALMAIRNVGLAVVVVVVLLGPRLADLGGTIDGRQSGPGVRWLARGAVVGLVVAGIGVATARPAVVVDDYPVDLVDWLDDRDLVADDQVRLGQRDYVGNYLTYRYGAEARVFMDDRFDFHPIDVIADHNTLLLGGDIDDALGRQGFDVVLWQTDGPLERHLRREPQWEIVVEDGDWFIACRVTSPVHARCRP